MCAGQSTWTCRARWKHAHHFPDVPSASGELNIFRHTGSHQISVTPLVLCIMLLSNSSVNDLVVYTIIYNQWYIIILIILINTYFCIVYERKTGMLYSVKFICYIPLLSVALCMLKCNLVFLRFPFLQMVSVSIAERRPGPPYSRWSPISANYVSIYIKYYIYIKYSELLPLWK